jgi:hypothetical protein
MHVSGFEHAVARYDKHTPMLFDGEEYSFAARLYAHGFNLYAPPTGVSIVTVRDGCNAVAIFRHDLSYLRDSKTVPRVGCCRRQHTLARTGKESQVLAGELEHAILRTAQERASHLGDAERRRAAAEQCVHRDLIARSSHFELL